MGKCDRGRGTLMRFANLSGKWHVNESIMKSDTKRKFAAVLQYRLKAVQAATSTLPLPSMAAKIWAFPEPYTLTDVCPRKSALKSTVVRQPLMLPSLQTKCPPFTLKDNLCRRKINFL